MEITKPPYLDYLEKEMTIMGILSAFCVGAVGLIIKESHLLSRLGDQTPASAYCIILGIAIMIAAAGFFYWQRALLAWHYGQISLWATDSDSAAQNLNEIISNSDTWSSWIPYQIGLCLTIGSFFVYAGVFLPQGRFWYEIAGVFLPQGKFWYEIIVLLFLALVLVYIVVVRIRRDKADTTLKPKRKSTRRLRSKPNDASSRA